MARRVLDASRRGSPDQGLGPDARHARAKLARAVREGAAPETIAALRRDFIVARATEQIDRAKAELAAVGHDLG